ncbi:MAG: FAD-dependent oxidoreductase [Planctomycetota bacterium]|jgi:hypothetical protein
MNSESLGKTLSSGILGVLTVVGTFCRSPAEEPNANGPFPAGTLDAAAVEREVDADVCVYCTTPSGILGAVAVKREGRSVVVVEPSRWVGGILGAGIKPRQDCPNYEATGGMTHDLLDTLGQPPDGRRLGSRDLSPQRIREDFLKLIEDRDVRVIYEHRISRVSKEDGAITQAFFDLAPFDAFGCPPENAEAPESLRVKAKVFIDASYDGELMARAGVSFRVGRESAAEFNEENAGVCEPMELTPIDPFVEAGNPESGLLPGVEADHGKPIGAADRYTQAYNYRYYVTSEPEHRIAFKPPADYDPLDYELVGRYVRYLAENVKDQKKLFELLGRIFPGWMNSGEYNYHRGSLITMAPVGISHLYADGDYATKARVWRQHRDYLRGLHHFMSTDPRVPEASRQKTASLGLDKRHHPETHGWPHQLYVRVSRRLAGRYTVTAHDVYNRTTVEDSIGLAQYGIDTYPARRIWLERDGQIYVALEGKMFVGGAKGPTNVPYPIPYRAITPKSDECTNLLVPVCFSATHLGYASARMEPVFMICGESAGVAAAEALDEKCAVQEIDALRLRDRLTELGQRLFWPSDGN